MVFSSLVFLYIFLPFVLIGLSICRKTNYQNAFLFLASVLFYSWGGPKFAIVFLCSILLNWFLGIAIEKWENQKKSILAASIILNLSILILYKYTNFFIDNWNAFVSIFNCNPITIEKIALPIGISFYTFQGVSYVIDVYRKTVPAQRNLITLGAYISLFPQLIAGPIIRYNEIQSQFTERKFSFDNIYKGIKRFLLGLARKVFIANQLAIIADAIFARSPETLSPLAAWIGILCYTLQIYYDFAGYSDMAIGLGKMFGFTFPENFNFPYISKSIKEFWRRWHITLSSWFKDYLYIPLGGNRCSKRRLYFNLYVVFFCTGFWHGASWNFIVWGLLHGTFLVIERSGFGEKLEKLFPFLQHLYTLLIVIIAWVFFRAENLELALQYICSMFIPHTNTTNSFLYEFATAYNYLIGIIAIVCATPFIAKVNDWFKLKSQSNLCLQITRNATIIIFMIVIMILTTNHLINGGYNPFIYFRF